MKKKERIQILRDIGIVNETQIQKLDEMGFFTAPASTRFHGDYEGGLFDHSLQVARILANLTEDLKFRWQREDSPWIIGMFHDLCKCDEYRILEGMGFDHVSKNRQVLVGHGGKSVMLLSQLMTLTEEEILCIRYHMGAYMTDEWDQYDLAIRKYEAVLWTHTADMLASKVIGI